MAGPTTLIFAESGTFEGNLGQFENYLERLDPVLGSILSPALYKIADENYNRETLLSELFTALLQEKDTVDQTVNAATIPSTDDTSQPAKPSATPIAKPAIVAALTGWFIENLEIEGFRGINNENSPLIHPFNSDAVSSISAPNGVGKSSIFDALLYALTGKIPKLERLAAAEKSSDYYNNRFHQTGVGTIKLTLKPDDGNPSVTLTVTRDVSGKRTVTAPVGIDGDRLLTELNREFVFLDGPTFQRFIDDKPIDRGRIFAELLGLGRYSSLRQALQGLAHTRSFNNHFNLSEVSTRRKAAQQELDRLRPKLGADFERLIKAPLESGLSTLDAKAQCHHALNSIPVLSLHCHGKEFIDIDIEACLVSIRQEEGGDRQEKYTSVLRRITELEGAQGIGPSEAVFVDLRGLAEARDKALSYTAGELLKELYQVSERVLLSEVWSSQSKCPTCDHDDGTSVLKAVQAKLAQYERVIAATEDAANNWISKNWSDLDVLRKKVTLDAVQETRLEHLIARGANGELCADDCAELIGYVSAMRDGVRNELGDLTIQRDSLKKELPPSLVSVTEAVESSRRLQQTWNQIAEYEAAEAKELAHERHINQLKKFLDDASSGFATAESAMANARLLNVEPVCRDLFGLVMGPSAVPALSKKNDAEELNILLANFWTLKDVSAQALLSESYRNAFAVSVYLAAASLYGGAPRFMVLDDVTSSFDAGHQLQLMNVIRTKFARPRNPNGPQVILLSHDTMLEKLFNKYNGTDDWQHKRLEGTAQTAVLLQSGAVNKVRDATIDLLNQGRVADAGPFIRQYLEYQLVRVITECNIPVPIDIAHNDDQRMAGRLLQAIDAAVAINKKAGIIVLEQKQQIGLNLHEATITSNYLSHWETGSTNGFAASALQKVMTAIDDFVDCFQWGSMQERRFYKSLSKKS